MDEGSIPEKPSVEVYHSQKLLESRFIHGQRKIPDGGDVFEERTEARTTEEVAGKLTLVEANCQRLGTAQLQEKLS